MNKGEEHRLLSRIIVGLPFFGILGVYTYTLGGKPNVNVVLVLVAVLAGCSLGLAQYMWLMKMLRNGIIDLTPVSARVQIGFYIAGALLCYLLVRTEYDDIIGLMISLMGFSFSACLGVAIWHKEKKMGGQISIVYPVGYKIPTILYVLIIILLVVYFRS